MPNPLQLTAPEVEALDEEKTQLVLDAWVEAKRSELPEALASSPSKMHARLAKKALYRLKSAGVSVAENKAAGVALPVLATPEAFDGLLTAVIGTGERAAFFARAQRGGGLEVFQSVFSDELGVLSLERTETSRAAYRGRLKAVDADENLLAHWVPLERIIAELNHALWCNQQSNTPLGEESDRCARLLGLEPLRREVAIVSPDDAALALTRESDTLHDQREIAEWLPSETALAMLSQRVEEVRASPLQQTDEQRLEQLEAKLAQTAAEYLTKESRALYARRLWAMGELYENNDLLSVAASCKAEAGLLAHTQRPSRFVEAMFEKALAMSQVSTPAAGGSLPAPRLSPGGVVLP